MIKKITYQEMTITHLEEIAKLYVETFNSEPWNDKWTMNTASKRLFLLKKLPLQSIQLKKLS